MKPAELTQVSRAAKMRGVSLSDFAHDAILREADIIIADELSVTLSLEQSRRFLTLMDAAFKPTAKLQNALDRIPHA